MMIQRRRDGKGGKKWERRRGGNGRKRENGEPVGGAFRKMYDYTLPHPASEYLRLLYVLKRQAARVTYWNAMGGAALVGTLPLLV